MVVARHTVTDMRRYIYRARYCYSLVVILIRDRTSPARRTRPHTKHVMEAWNAADGVHCYYSLIQERTADRSPLQSSCALRPSARGVTRVLSSTVRLSLVPSSRSSSTTTSRHMTYRRRAQRLPCLPIAGYSSSSVRCARVERMFGQQASINSIDRAGYIRSGVCMWSAC